MTGDLHCSICDAKFQTQINTLTEPIDIFTEWLDEASEMQAQSTNIQPNRNVINNNNNSNNRKNDENVDEDEQGDDDDGGFEDEEEQ